MHMHGLFGSRSFGLIESEFFDEKSALILWKRKMSEGGVGIYLSPKLFVCNRAMTRWSEKAKKWRTVEGYEPGGISRPDIRHFGPGAFPILRTGLDGSSWSEDCGIVLLCAFG